MQDCRVARIGGLIAYKILNVNQSKIYGFAVYYS